MKKRKINIIINMVILGIIGLSIGSLYDLQINTLLYSRGNIFPQFFKITGEMPMIIMIMISSLLILRDNFYKLNTIKKLLLFLLFIIFPIGSALSIQSYFGVTNIAITIIISTFYFLITILISKKINMRTKEFTKYLVFIILSIITIFILFNILKNIWGRMRFFAMYANNDYSNFTNWWQINGFPKSDVYRSFPSGHTASAATTLVLALIQFNNKRIENALKYFSISWTILVALSRILDGAHFLSDVSMSIIISGIVIALFDKIINKNRTITK